MRFFRRSNIPDTIRVLHVNDEKDPLNLTSRFLTLEEETLVIDSISNPLSVS